MRVYIMTAKEFWNIHAPDFNFELGIEELVAEALKRGFIVESWAATEDGETQYLYADDELN
jgi:hypothetical protein